MSTSAALNPRDAALEQLAVKKNVTVGEQLTAKEIASSKGAFGGITASSLIVSGSFSPTAGAIGDAVIDGQAQVTGLLSANELSVAGPVALGTTTSIISLNKQPFITYSDAGGAPVGDLVTYATAPADTGKFLTGGVKIAGAVTLPSAAAIEGSTNGGLGVSLPLGTTFQVAIVNTTGSAAALTLGANTTSITGASFSVPANSTLRLTYLKSSAAGPSPTYNVF